MYSFPSLLSYLDYNAIKTQFFVWSNRSFFKYVNVQSGVDSVFQCCIRVNHVDRATLCEFHVTENCELLKDTDAEFPELLHKDENFDYLVLLQANRISHIIVVYNICNNYTRNLTIEN